jgi:hypothetical protein
MYKLVLQAVLFSTLAIGFIVFKSDGLRHAAQTGDMSHLSSTSVAAASYMSLTDQLSGQSGHAAASAAASNGRYDAYGSRSQPWYVKYDPRQLWHARPKQIKLNPKTIRVPQSDGASPDSLADQLAQKGLSVENVNVVKLN